MTDSDKDAQDAKTVFSALIAIPAFFKLFNEIAYSKYRKSPNIKEDHFKGYAKAYHLPPKWVYACAIDVIAKHTNPLSIITENCLFVLWIKPCIRIGVDKDDVLNKLKEWGASNNILHKTMQFAIA